jgi:hypothetical protein
MLQRILPVISLLSLAALSADAQQGARLDTTTFVVLGEGLAAGMANFGLSDTVQNKSFPAQVARQMNTAFPQPLIQGPGIGDVLGYPALPVRFPTYPQGSVRVFPTPQPGDSEAPTLFVFNLAVPNSTVVDAVNRRPVPPLIHDNDNQQTMINLLLGFPSLILNKNVPLWSQIEYAEAMNPTLALVELGYYEALNAMVSGDPGLIPDAATFTTSYTAIVKRLRAMNAQVVVTTIPDPINTAYLTPPVAAANNLLKTPPFVVLLGYNLNQNDYITRNGLTAIGNQLIVRNIKPLPAGSTLPAAVAATIRTRVAALNTAISSVAQSNGAVVYDLAAFFAKVKASGAAIPGGTLTGDYLGGFYSLDGYYPSVAGHALIANDLIAFLNKTYGTSFAAVDLSKLDAGDAIITYRPASAPPYSASEFGFSDPGVK